MPDISTVTVVVSAAVGVLTGALIALKAVAPHTETKIDDKAVEYGEKALPLMVRLLEYLRGKSA